MTREECGFILLIFIVTNAIGWLFGWDMDIKDKIIIPNVLVICFIGIMFALKMMGVE
jgi:hypothetical protein